MIILLFFAFLSGLVTILAPCIWPLLPIILSSSTTGGHRKPLGITLGIITSFAIFTLSISYLVMTFHFDPDVLRLLAVIVIGFLGTAMVVPSLLRILEGFVSKLSGTLGSFTSKSRGGFTGGFVTGSSLGIVWSPCAGPILATIATLGATQTVNFSSILVTAAYSIGVGIPLFLFSYAGSSFFNKSKFLSKYLARIQQVFGIVMIFTAAAIYTNYDKVLQAKLLDSFPSYSTFLTGLESNETVKQQLDIIRGKKNMRDIEQEKKPSSSLPNLGKAPEFVGIYKWLNVNNPLTMQEMRGKVVLIDFWTYTCINCIRTLPYVTSWYNKYRDLGFVVVGVHTPEFEFEKKAENVENAIKQYKILYPVAQDNDYKTWDAYNNRYWPAKYLIDHEGNIRYTHFGEGKYEETEKAIQELLKERGSLVDKSTIQLEDQTPWTTLTPETYLGRNRIDRFESPEPIQLGKKSYTQPKTLPLHNVAFEGTWNVMGEYSVAEKGAMLEIQFLASKVFLVMIPANADDQVLIYLDGKLLEKTVAGSDVVNGAVQFDMERLYNLIDLKGEKGEHRLRLEFKTGGTSLYAFTFG